MKPFSLLSLIYWYIYLLSPNITALASNETDHFALLKFKESILGDPYGILESWNSSTHFCKWHGITCNTVHQRVIELNLTGYQLHGLISPYIGNISFLEILDLSKNNINGKIPQEIGRLLQLQQLFLMYNSLSGEIPIHLTNSSELRVLQLSWNKLIGRIPTEIGALLKLKNLRIGANELSGQIPPSIGNLSSLLAVAIGENNLEGDIPQEMCDLANFKVLGVHSNKLSGMFPSCLYNMSSLLVISVAVNQLNGSLPPSMFDTLPNLQVLDIGGNQISGPIPTSIANASVLFDELDISRNHFIGQFPNLRMPYLTVLSASFNHLGSNSTKDFDFLRTLTNCSELSVLSISGNKFGGHLPNFLGNFSAQLSQLYLGDNQISGKLPSELGNLIGLTLLGMQENHFHGTIPFAFGKLQQMQKLELGRNKLTGEIPASIGNMSQLFNLSLGENMLEGNIPPSIGNCLMLQYLDLSQNNLRGTIPKEVFSISSLTILLNLSRNLLSGSLHDKVGRLQNINSMDVSENHLSSNIPATIGECINLEYLFLQGNSFHGMIPSSLALLKGLRKLDLSRNRLFGPIPKDLQNISAMEYLNVSFNMLDGMVPTKGVFQNASQIALNYNIKLCGGISELHLPPCHVEAKNEKKHHELRLVAVIVGVVSFILILSIIVTVCWMRKKNKKPTFDSPTIDQVSKVSYQSLHQATDGFSTTNLIGSGSFGSVYKGNLDSEEKIVAVKVLNLQKKGADKSFIAECNALKNTRHRNLVKILTCCSSIDYQGHEFKALVFEYMANGSLERWLHPVTGIANQPRPLDLEQRINIIIDVASAFHYLHYECEQAIIHCDLKPSNVLLDDSMIARVTDFGLARLLSTFGVSPMETGTVGIKGTIGYTPPEYGMSSEASIQGDMYSFGVLVLEMLTARRPTDEMFKDGRSLHNYVMTSIPNKLLQIVDPTILPKEIELASDNITLVCSDAEKCLLSLFRVGLDCSMESPRERMNMADVTRELNLIKSSFPWGE